MTSLQKLTQCSGCAKAFNAATETAAPAAKPQIPLYDICPCYRPKM